VAEHLPQQAEWLVQTIVQLEPTKWPTRDVGEDKADRVIAFRQVACVECTPGSAVEVGAPSFGQCRNRYHRRPFPERRSDRQHHRARPPFERDFPYATLSLRLR